MFGYEPFYHGLGRKYVVLFGSLFNNISIDRVDPETGAVTQNIAIPVSYGPKAKYLVRLKENPDLLREVNQILPRITFEFGEMTYDPDRKLGSVGRTKTVSANGNIMSSQYNPVPYNFSVNLSVLARNADDGFRIVEQIAPFFKPEWTTKLNLIPEMGIDVSVPIVLKSIKSDDNYDEKFESRYAITWDLEFVIKGYLYGPITTQGVIQSIEVDFGIPTTNTSAEGVGITPKLEWFTVTPGLDANGNPTSNASISVNTNLILANSNYGYITDFFSDD
jgi:hypothetical protein